MTRQLITMLLLSSVLSACNEMSPKISNDENSVNIANNKPGNVVKLLNRVTCENALCTQENVNKMWQICLSSGWTEHLKIKEVKSSRDLQELVSGQANYEETITQNVEQTDQMGVVSTVPITRKIMKEATYSGYCIGTEYISD